MNSIDQKSGHKIRANQKIRASVALMRFCCAPWNTGHIVDIGFAHVYESHI